MSISSIGCLAVWVPAEPHSCGMSRLGGGGSSGAALMIPAMPAVKGRTAGRILLPALSSWLLTR